MCKVVQGQVGVVINIQDAICRAGLIECFRMETFSFKKVFCVHVDVCAEPVVGPAR